MPLDNLKARLQKTVSRHLRPEELKPDVPSATCVLAEHLVPQYRMAIVSTNRPRNLSPIETLLEQGANPNIIIHIYSVSGKTFIKCVQTHDASEAYIRPEGKVGKETARERHILHRYCPLIDGLVNRDLALVRMLFEYGARVSSVVDFVHKHVRGRDIDAHLADMARKIEQTTASSIEIGTFADQDALNPWYELLLDHEEYFFTHKLLTDQNISSMRERIRHKLVSHMRTDSIWREKRFEELPSVFHGIPEVLAAALFDDPRLFCTTSSRKLNLTTSKYRGITALHLAVGNPGSELCRYLTARGANANAVDHLGVTPLFEAVYFGNHDAVQCLLEFGAETNPVHWWRQADTTLINKSRDIIPRAIDGPWRTARDRAFKSFAGLKWSITHISVWQGSESILKLLLQQPYALSHEFMSSTTALDLAIALSQDHLAYMLLRHRDNMKFDTATLSASQLLERAIEEGRTEDADRLRKCGVPRLPHGRFAFFQRTKYGGTDDIVDDLRHPVRQGPPLILDIDEVSTLTWTFHGRLPHTCTHLQKKNGNKISRIDHISEPTWQPCFFCVFMFDHECCIPREILPFGADLALGLRRHEEAQSCHLVTRIASVQRQHAIKYVSSTWRDVLELQRLDTRETSHSGSPAASAMVGHWVRSCIAAHKLCHVRNTDRAPTRLLELLDRDGLRLVENLSPAQPYVTLSHRWGDDTASQTKRGNLKSRLYSLPSSQPTPTMRESIKVVRNLGYRFLWIDALCIVQDSEEDWRYEASQMSSVYNNAALTLAASCYDKQDRGMFRRHQLQAQIPFPFQCVENFVSQDLRHLRETGDDEEGDWYVFPATRGVHSGIRPKSILDTRGWILQEQLLSPRILYYEEDQMYWDCVTQSASEISPISSSLLEDKNPDETWAFKILRRATAGSGDTFLLRKHIAEIWVHVVQNYSARHLSHAKDKLVALQGIIQAIEERLDLQSTADMWQRELWRQLIWWKVPVSPDTTSDSGGDCDDFGPSWSWLNVHGPVSYYKRLHRPAQKKLFVDLTPLVTTAFAVSNDQNSAPIARDTLKITGSSFVFHLTLSDLVDSGRSIVSKNGLALGHVTWLLDKVVKLPIDVHCVIVGEDEIAKELVCLCLVPDSITPGQHKRIGLCQWNGLTWQVAKYAGRDVADLEQKTFRIV